MKERALGPYEWEDAVAKLTVEIAKYGPLVGRYGILAAAADAMGLPDLDSLIYAAAEQAGWPAGWEAEAPIWWRDAS